MNLGNLRLGVHFRREAFLGIGRALGAAEHRGGMAGSRQEGSCLVERLGQIVLAVPNRPKNPWTAPRAMPLLVPPIAY